MTDSRLEVLAALHLLASRVYLDLSNRRLMTKDEMDLLRDIGRWHQQYKTNQERDHLFYGLADA